MVHCVCGKPMDKVPDWLQSVKVEFVCNNCPDRKTKNIAFITLEPVAAPVLPESLGEVADLLESEEEIP